jgi:hypothetical protein
MTRIVAVGFRAKTGRAICVALAGPEDAPEFLWRGETALADPALPGTAEPYHQVMDLPWEEGQLAVQPLVTRIELVAREAVALLIRELGAQGGKVRALGVVGSADRSLAKIGNYHIRAHAAEGILFRRVLEVAAAQNRLQCRAFSEKEVSVIAASELGGAARVAAHLKALGARAGSPWRADERAAATAAWLALGERERRGSERTDSAREPYVGCGSPAREVGLSSSEKIGGKCA